MERSEERRGNQETLVTVLREESERARVDEMEAQRVRAPEPLEISTAGPVTGNA
jgi:hypothetical protein